MKKNAIILLNYNSSDDCRKCIGFLHKQKKVEPIIIVVDNCSKHEEHEKVKSLCQKTGCILISNDVNRGYNAGNNVGLRYAAERGFEVAMIANPDMEFPQQDYLRKCLDVMADDFEIAVLGTDILHAQGWHQNPQIGHNASYWSLLTSPLKLFCQFLLRKTMPKLTEDYHVSRYCEKVSGCCFFIRMSFLKEIGFLDEGVFLYCEEPILAKQVKLNHKKMYYLAEAQAIHNHIATAKGNPRKNMKIMQKSQLYYFQNYGGYNGIAFWYLFVTRKIFYFFWNFFLALKK